MLGIKVALKYLLFLFVFLEILPGCNIINPAEQTPTYIHVDSFSFKPNPAEPAAALSYQINSVWAYYNYSLIGVFDLPATFPVIATGSGQLTLEPGISVDGLNSFLAAYPFYRPDTTTLIAQPGKVINAKPVATYYSGFSCVNIAGTGFLPLASSQVQISFNGNLNCYEIYLNNPDDSCESYTSNNYVIPLNQAAYLEFDYNTNNTFYVGAQANLAGSGVVEKLYLTGVNATGGKWQKFYLALEDFVAQTKGTSYTFFIKASLDPEISSGQVLLRNIQLLHY